MRTLRKTIRLKPDLDRLLKQIYLNWGFPIDQYAQRPRALSAFTEEWNALSGRTDPPDDIRHYMITKRKAGKWVRFNGEHTPLRSPKEYDLKPLQWAALRAAYLLIDEGRDQFASSASLRDRLASEFYTRCGSAIAPDLLYAAAMAMQKHRKNGWPRLGRSKAGFSDIDLVA